MINKVVVTLGRSDEPETEDASPDEAISCFGINIDLSS